MPARHTRGEGTISFAGGALQLDASEPGVLLMTATAEDAAALERIEQVVASYLERTGRADNVRVTWT